MLSNGNSSVTIVVAETITNRETQSERVGIVQASIVDPKGQLVADLRTRLRLEQD